jgi:chromate transporter
MSALDWLHLLLFHLSMSLLAVGGAVTLMPGLHRFLVTDQGWLTGSQFNHALVLAQVAPGPNVLYVALMGWQVGSHGAGAQASPEQWLGWSLLGLLISLVGVLGPSSVLTLAITRWCRRHQEHLAIQAFRQGMAPLVVGVLWASAWLLARGDGLWQHAWPQWTLTAVCALLVWTTRLHLLWMLAAGALAGALQWV